jgi:cytochrome c-type biogenesis protein CcmH
MSARLVSALALMLALALPVQAVQPDEVLADTALEARAREISRSVRCPVCQGESIDDSNAPISKDLRIIIRERLTAGDTDQQVLDFLVARYGEFVLFDPPKSGANLLLWLAGPAMLLVGGGIAFAALRRKAPPPEDALTAEEQARLDDILKG